MDPGADLGGGTLPFQGFDPSPTKGPPWVLFYDIHFRPSNPKTFLKAPSPIYTNAKGQRAPKKNFIGQKFPKSAKNGIFDLFLFFSNFACGANLFA